MNLPDEIQSQAAQREVAPRRENSVSRVFIEALYLLGPGTGQTECQDRLILQIVLRLKTYLRKTS